MAEQLLETLKQDATSLLDQARKAGNNVLLEDTKESTKVLFDIENIYKHSLSSGSKLNNFFQSRAGSRLEYCANLQYFAKQIFEIFTDQILCG